MSKDRAVMKTGVELSRVGTIHAEQPATSAQLNDASGSQTVRQKRENVC